VAPSARTAPWCGATPRKPALPSSGGGTPVERVRLRVPVPAIGSSGQESHVTLPPLFVRDRTTKETFEDGPRRAALGTCEQTNGRNKKVVEQALVEARHPVRFLERPDCHFGVRSGGALAKLALQRVEIESLPVDGGHASGIGAKLVLQQVWLHLPGASTSESTPRPLVCRRHRALIEKSGSNRANRGIHPAFVF
jgi:hypothetical protein